jgi:hypothetical protein
MSYDFTVTENMEKRENRTHERKCRGKEGRNKQIIRDKNKE